MHLFNSQKHLCFTPRLRTHIGCRKISDSCWLLQMKMAKSKPSMTALRTVCVPRMKVSRERHMGNRTRLQFRLSTDADALLMHRPSCETQKDHVLLAGICPVNPLPVSKSANSQQQPYSGFHGFSYCQIWSGGKNVRFIIRYYQNRIR